MVELRRAEQEATVGRLEGLEREAFSKAADERSRAKALAEQSTGLAIVDADGSNVREFGFATSGPWHPGG